MTIQSALLSLFLAATLATPALAQDDHYPDRPVTVITPFPVGSGPDTALRLVSEKLAKVWGQPIVVNNKPGGGGFIAIEQANRAAPDGYTLLQLDSEHLGALPHLYKSRNFVPLHHFDAVAPMFRTPFLVAVSTQSKWQTIGDLISAAKANPAKIVYGSWGVGSPGHLGAVRLEEATSIRMQHAPYREVSQLFADVGSGEIYWSFASIPSSQAIYKSGRLRYLAVAAQHRIPQMPNIPTIEESGGPASLEVDSFVSLLVPKGVSRAIKSKITADIAKVLTDPEIRSRFDTFAYEPLSWTPEEIVRNAEAKFKIYGELVRVGNITVE